MTTINDRVICLSKGELYLLCANNFTESVYAELSVDYIV